MDLSSPESIDRCCDELGKDLGRIAVLVNNAGAFAGGQLEEQETGDVYGLIQANLAGPSTSPSASCRRCSPAGGARS